MNSTMLAMPQGAEWLVILLIVVLVFGAAKLPDLARGTGQALRIFKAETKGLIDDDETPKTKKQSSELSPARTEEVRPGEVRPEEIRPEGLQPEGIRPEGIRTEPVRTEDHKTDTTNG